MALTVSYSLVSQSKLESGLKKLVFDVSFGDGVETYASGAELDKAKLGCPNVIKSLVMIEPAAGNGLVYKFDESAASLRIYQGDYSESSDGPLVELASGATPAAATLRVQVEGF